jgi:hypothetical protein
LRKTLDKLSGDTFTQDERRRLRHMLEEEERMVWLWATIRIWVGGLAAAVAATWAIVDFIPKLLRNLIGGP